MSELPPSTPKKKLSFDEALKEFEASRRASAEKADSENGAPPAASGRKLRFDEALKKYQAPGRASAEQADGENGAPPTTSGRKLRFDEALKAHKASFKPAEDKPGGAVGRGRDRHREELRAAEIAEKEELERRLADEVRAKQLAIAPRPPSIDEQTIDERPKPEIQPRRFPHDWRPSERPAPTPGRGRPPGRSL